MSKNQNLKALPSMVILANGHTIELSKMKKEEKMQVEVQMGKNISRQLGHYYSTHPEEWKIFLQVMSE